MSKIDYFLDPTGALEEALETMPEREPAIKKLAAETRRLEQEFRQITKSWMQHYELMKLPPDSTKH